MDFYISICLYYRVQQQYEEERLQRLVQQEAVKFLWKQVSDVFATLHMAASIVKHVPCVLLQLQSMQQWKRSVEQQLASISQAVTPVQISAPGLCVAVAPVASSTTNPPARDLSFPDSGFQSTSDQQAAAEDSFLSSGTTDSLKTVRALSPVQSGFAGASDGVDSADCSLLEQYLSSVQQREEEAEEAFSDGTETEQSSSPVSPSKTTQASPLPSDNQSEQTPHGSD